jgi:uridylate kinase
VRLIGTSHHIPGGHYPFDPIAARQAQKHKIRVLFVDGRNLREVKKVLLGQKFVGTVIH